jgi:hypothetical protein
VRFAKKRFANFAIIPKRKVLYAEYNRRNCGCCQLGWNVLVYGGGGFNPCLEFSDRGSLVTGGVILLAAQTWKQSQS